MIEKATKSFIMLARYLKKSPTNALLTFALIMICVFTWDAHTLIQKYSKTESPEQINEQFDRFNKTNGKLIPLLNLEMKKVLSQTKSQRSKMFEYHNGVDSIMNNSKKFHYSCKAESTAVGVSKECLNLQNLPTHRLNAFSDELWERNECVYVVISELPNSALKETMEGEGIVKSIYCPITRANNARIGLVGVDYTINADIDVELIKSLLRDSSMRIIGQIDGITHAINVASIGVYNYR